MKHKKKKKIHILQLEVTMVYSLCKVEADVKRKLTQVGMLYTRYKSP